MEAICFHGWNRFDATSSVSMENQFAESLHEFFLEQNKDTRLGILEYYSHTPPENMYLFWNARFDERLSKNAKSASQVLDLFFLSKKNTYISFELAHRQAQKLFKRLYLDKHVCSHELQNQHRGTRELSTGRDLFRSGGCQKTSDGSIHETVHHY